MDLARIAKHIEAAEEAISVLESEQCSLSEAVGLHWRVAEHLAAVRASADCVSAREPGQVLVRRLLLEEVDHLTAKACRAVSAHDRPS